MDNPFLVEVVRGHLVESRHRGSVSVVEADGGMRVFARRRGHGRSSRARPSRRLQALPLVESGIAEQFGLTDEEIALACASHSGEPAHVAVAAAMLAKAGRDVSCLECGTHWPMGEAANRALAASGRQAHAPCTTIARASMRASSASPAGRGATRRATSGPATWCSSGSARRSKTSPARATTRSISGIDGCSIPTYAIPLPAMAFGFARFGTGVGVSPDTAKAAARIRRAVAAHPFMVAGTDRFDTKVMEILGERAFVKVGAEGVYCAALPELGYGIALKADDGGTRAAEAMMGALLLRYLTLDGRRARRHRGSRPPGPAELERHRSRAACAQPTSSGERNLEPQQPDDLVGAGGRRQRSGRDGLLDFRHALAQRRVVREPIVQALVDEGPHPFGVLRAPFRREFARRLQALAMVEHLAPELVEPLAGQARDGDDGRRPGRRRRG